MTIQQLKKRLYSPRTLPGGLPSGQILLIAAALLIAATAGYSLGGHQTEQRFLTLSNTLQNRTLSHQRVVHAATQAAQQHMDVLGQRLGQLQARLIRLDALGQRLTDLAGLQAGEFDFQQDPPLGGSEPLPEAHQDSGEFLVALAELDDRLENHTLQLSVMEDLLLERKHSDQMQPRGRPILSGWLSSPYGRRNDPFTGKPSFHYGVDLAGKKGSDVISVAAGIVTWAGEKRPYGKLVEIDHGNGYVTRYGHGERLLVKTGDTVTRGQVVAHMGSSGRSTGPHVHFEVWKDGKTVNPAKYLRTKG